MRKFHSKRSALLAAAGVLVVAAVAYAWWSTGGSGSGSADAGNVVDVTVNQTSTVSGLYPGGPDQALSGDFDNPNDGSVYIGTVKATLASVDNGTSNPADPDCTIADFELVEDEGVVDAEIPSGNGVGSWSGPSVRLLNTASDQDNCKDATVNIDYEVVAP